MDHIIKPIIGYVEALISLRLDLDLMINIAKRRKDWSFVLIGPDDDAFSTSALYNLSNIYYLGKQHTKEIPAYINHFDLCINPQLVNDTAMGNFPLKIIEYLAIGKPVVATATDFMKEVFESQTYLANNDDEYIQCIETALQEDSEVLKENRISFSKQYSWDKIAQNLLSAIKKSQ